MLQVATLAQVATIVDVDDCDIHELVTCASCGTVTAPDGRCMEIGACETADTGATRGAARQTSKFGIPAAWNARGSVD